MTQRASQTSAMHLASKLLARLRLRWWGRVVIPAVATVLLFLAVVFLFRSHSVLDPVKANLVLIAAAAAVFLFVVISCLMTLVYRRQWPTILDAALFAEAYGHGTGTVPLVLPMKAPALLAGTQAILERRRTASIS